MRSLSDRAKQVLAENDMGVWTKPSPKLYPHQWNWDSGFIAIGLAHWNLERAKTEIRSLLRGQWQNGMIPHIIYDPESTGYYPDPHVWQISLSPNAPLAPLTSAITQPPMITIAALEIAKRDRHLDFAREIYPALLHYHRWFYRERDLQNQGLVSILHPWESGMDNSPRWLGILDAIEFVTHPEYRREDNNLVPPYDRPTNLDYDHFIFLMNLARELKYNQAQITQESQFIAWDVLLNSILFRANDALRQLAEMLGETTEEIDRWMHRGREAFTKKLWNEEDGLYYDYDVRNARLIRENTIAAFMPLYAGVAEDAHARRLVQDHLLDSSEYAPDLDTTQFRVPTASKSNRYFDPRGYWRGPVWVNLNWFLIQGLIRYGYDDLARQIRQDTLALVENADFYEYFDPRTGTGYGTDKFSSSAALVIDLVENGDN